MTWLTEIRKIALVGLVFNLLSILGLWIIAQRFGGILDQIDSVGLIMIAALALLLLVVAAVVLAVLFALYNNEGELQISEHLRGFLRAAACVWGIQFAVAALAVLQSGAHVGPMNGSSAFLALSVWCELLANLLVLLLACGVLPAAVRYSGETADLPPTE